MKLKLCTILLTVVMTFLFVSTAYCRTVVDVPAAGGKIQVEYYRPDINTGIGGINGGWFDFIKAEDKSIKEIPSCGYEFYTAFGDYEWAMYSGAQFIREGAFADCKDLYYANFNYFYNIRIEENAFKNCTSLRRVILPECLDIRDNAFDGCDKSKLVISCNEGSKVEAFCVKNGIKYDHNVERVVGDADGDGLVTAKDVSLVMQYVLNPKNISSECEYAGLLSNCDVSYDANNWSDYDYTNRIINSEDVAEILQNSLDSSHNIYTKPFSYFPF
ncbi:MAG: leucine-rich repeat protein [Lachnospirales bacterium]